MTGADSSEEVQHEEYHERPEWMPEYHFAGLQCGWCDEWITGYFSKDAHVRLLWHQWFNHRERIWEEY